MAEQNSSIMDGVEPTTHEARHRTESGWTPWLVSMRSVVDAMAFRGAPTADYELRPLYTADQINAAAAPLRARITELKRMLEEAGVSNE